MGKNFEYAGSLPGILKFISLGLAVITTILGYLAFFGSDLTFTNDELKTVEITLPWKEIFYLVVCTLALVGGVVDILAHLFSQAIIWDRRTAFVDFGFHVVSAALFIAVGFLMAVSAVEIFDTGCTSENDCQAFNLKLAATGLSLLTGVTYGGAGVVVFTNRHDVER